MLLTGQHGEVWIGANAGLLRMQGGLVGNRRGEIGRSPIRDIVQTRGGTTVLDLTLAVSNTYNPYVVFPVPENIPWDGVSSSGQ